MILKLGKHYCKNMSQAEKQSSKLSWNTNEAAKNNKKSKQKKQCSLKWLPNQITFQNQEFIKKQSHRPAGNLLNFSLLLMLCCFTFETAAQKTVLDTYYYVGCFTARTDLLKESVYAKTPLTCIEICQHQNYSYAILYGEQCFCSYETHESERQDDILCNTRCIANKEQFCGGVGMHSYYSTSREQQPAVNHLAIANATENSLLIIWQSYLPGRVFIAGGAEAPQPIDAPKILHFLIRLNKLHSYSAMPFYAAPEFIVQSSETRFEITDLHPATEYNITVLAICEQLPNDVCGSGVVRGTTLIGQPSPEPPQPKIISQKDNKIEIEIPPLRNDNGPLTKLLIIVERVDDSLSQPFDTSLLSDWKKAQEDGLPYYIAAELDYDRPEDNRTRRFIVGDGKRYGRFVNMPLNANAVGSGENVKEEMAAHFHVSLGIVSKLNFLCVLRQSAVIN